MLTSAAMCEKQAVPTVSQCSASYSWHINCSQSGGSMVLPITYYIELGRGKAVWPEMERFDLEAVMGKFQFPSF